MHVQNPPLPPKYPPDFLRNGLQFESDRRHKNRLVIRVITCMTVLTIVATCAFIGWSKVRGFSDADQQLTKETRVTLIITKVPINYDTDAVQTAGERSVLPDVRTEFIPTFHSQDPTTSSRATRQTKQDDKATITGNVGFNTSNLEVLEWVKVSSDKTKRNVLDMDENNTKTDSKASDVPSIQRSASREVFWTAKGDAESIRKSQAQRMTSYMDLTADPCQDFYQYACGRWGDNNQIPEDRTQFDTFEMLRESLDSVLRDLLLEDPSKDPEAIRKAKLLFKSCMNEDILEEKGNTPLIELLNSFGGWPMIDSNWTDNGFDWLEMSAKLRIYNNEILIMQWVSPDFKSSSNYIIQFDQAALGLPTREYFLQEQNRRYLEAYRQFMLSIAVLLGANPEQAADDMNEITDFETTLANISTPADQRHNVSAMYEKLTLSQLESELPQIAWRKYLSIVLQREPEADESVVMFARNYYIRLINLLESTSNRTIANYMLWRFVKNRVNNLDARFQDAKQEFFHALFGREKVPPRWSTCVMHVNSNMGMAVGSMFVRRYFDENSKNDTLTMTQGIMETFTGMLEDVEWIDMETRRLAREKVAAMVLRIGYPDLILDLDQLNLLYQNLSISESEYFENTLNLLQHSSRTEQSRLGTLVDRTQWGAAPAIVNAYYSRNKNQIMFPAGILQPPFYHQHFPRSLNYGGIGVVIGHEIIHGFDDKGRLFDLYGNLQRWWKDEALEGFRQRAQCLIDQYNTYIVKEVEMNIDGLSTQGENIADNGGMKQAYKAYEKWVEIHGDENETLPGVNVTNWQLFFINFAQVWCGSMRPEASRNKLQTGVHSPGKFRVIGTLSNLDEFAQAFNCASTSYMNPTPKCRVW